MTDELFIWDLMFKVIIFLGIGGWIGEKIDEYLYEKKLRSSYAIDLEDWKIFSNKLDQVYAGSLAIKEGKFVDPQEVEL
jgi:hypothetical protein